MLSVKHVTGVPIRFIGTGEHLDNLDFFRPDGMAGRILGMGDIVGMAEEARKLFDEKEQQKVNGEESLSSLLCNERTEWSNVQIKSLEKPKWYDLSYHIFEIPLLGDEYRRGTNEDVFSVQFQIISKLKDALFSSSVPYHIQLSPNTPQTTNVLFRFIDYIKYELL